MKRIYLALFFILLSFAAATPVCAKESDEWWKDFVEIAPPGSVEEDFDKALDGVGVDALLAKIIDEIRLGSGNAVSFFSLLLGIAALISVCEGTSLLDSFSPSKHAAASICALGASLIFFRLSEVVNGVREGLSELSLFFSNFLPIASGILAAGGNVNSAATQALNMNVTLGAVAFLSSELLLPLVFSLFALALTAGIDCGTASSVAKWIKGAFTWLVGIASALIIGAVSMQSLISGAKDGAYLRAAKYVAGGMIPVVGSTVSSSLSALSGGLTYVKSVVGACAVAVVVGIALAPLIQLLLYRLALSLSASLVEAADSKGGVRVFTAFRGALDALISVYALVCVVCIVELAVFIKSGVSVFG